MKNRPKCKQYCFRFSPEYVKIIESEAQRLRKVTGIETSLSDALRAILVNHRRMRGKEALDEIHKHAKETGLDKMTMEEIDAEIADVRKNRRRRP